MVSKKSARSLIFMCILILTGCFKPAPDPIDLNAQIHLPIEWNNGASKSFIPADVAIPVTFTLSPIDILPQDCAIYLRVIDLKGREYHRRRWPIPRSNSNTIEITRMFRMENLPGSRDIVLQAGIGESSGHMFSTKITHVDIWHDIFSGNALYSSINLSDGWFPVESEHYFSRRCSSRCSMHFAQPLLPTVLCLQGSAPIACFDEQKWTLTVFQNAHHVYQETITSSHFDTSFTIQPGIHAPDCSVADQSWPAGEIDLEITSDKTFSPHICQGANDKRTQAFHVSKLEKGDFLPKTGFYGSRETDHHFWPAPNCSVHLPACLDNTVLYIQGRRDMVCVDEAQTMQLFLNGMNLGAFRLEQDFFMLSIPCAHILQDIDSGNSVELAISVSPVFFRAQCMMIDDPNPYGVGIDEICFRPALP